MPKLTYAKPKDAGMDPERIALLAKRAPTWLDPLRMRSAVMLAARRGKIFFHEAFGTLTWRDDTAATPKDAIHRVASITKPVTATAAMILVEDGLLGLNRPIREYLPEICGKGTEEIEVQHLMTHTAGYDEDEIYEHYMACMADGSHAHAKSEPGLHHDVAQYFSSSWNAPVHWAPGSKMGYADHNINLLGEITRRIAGVPLEDFAKERLFDPMGLVDTTYRRNEEKIDRISCRRKEMVLPEGVWGADGLNTTALDLAAFGQMFLDKGKYGDTRILSPASVHEMTRNQIPGVGVELDRFHPEASWSLGWAIQHDERWKWCVGSLAPKGNFYHMGAGGHCIWVDPISEVVGVFLSVALDWDMETMNLNWNFDLFQNMVMAAVTD